MNVPFSRSHCLRINSHAKVGCNQHVNFKYVLVPESRQVRLIRSKALSRMPVYRQNEVKTQLQPQS